jgi:hypothetical protein
MPRVGVLGQLLGQLRSGCRHRRDRFEMTSIDRLPESDSQRRRVHPLPLFDRILQ